MAEWKGDEAKQIYYRAAQAAVGIAAEALLTEANKTVPIEEATLERSGSTSVDEQRTRTRNAVAVVSYDTPYARVQHERTDFAHDPGRRAKWLQFALEEKTRALRDLMIDEIQRRVP